MKNNPKYWETATVNINVRPVKPTQSYLVFLNKSNASYLRDIYQTDCIFITYTECAFSHASFKFVTVRDFKTLACIHGQLVDDLGYRIPIEDWLAYLEYEVSVQRLTLPYSAKIKPTHVGDHWEMPKCCGVSNLAEAKELWDKFNAVQERSFRGSVADIASPKPPKIPTWLIALILVAVLAIASHTMFGYTVVTPSNFTNK